MRYSCDMIDRKGPFENQQGSFSICDSVGKEIMATAWNIIHAQTIIDALNGHEEYRVKLDAITKQRDVLTESLDAIVKTEKIQKPSNYDFMTKLPESEGQKP